MTQTTEIKVPKAWADLDTAPTYLRVWLHLLQDPYISTSQLADAVGCSTRNVSKAVKRGVDLGLFKRTIEDCNHRTMEPIH